MKTLFGSLLHMLVASNKAQMVWCAVMLLMDIVLVVLHHRWKEDEGRLKKWRLLCLLPSVAALIHLAVYVRGYPPLFGDYIRLYIIALLALVPVPFARRRRGYRISSAAAGVLSVLCGLSLIFASPNNFNHAREGYTDSFRSLVRDLDRHYVLKEWKDVDLRALEQKYLPLIEEAERDGDREKFAEAVYMFCSELHDGHVRMFVRFDFDTSKGRYNIMRRDYGLAMIQLDSGEVIAVCTTPEVNAFGIKDGTRITRWNGKPVQQAAAEDVPDRGMPVKANADRLAALELSAVGSDMVTVSFIDPSGREQTVDLPELKGRDTFREAEALFSHDLDEDENFSARMLDDRCGYLRLSAEKTDSTLHDDLGYLFGDHKWARELFRERLRDLRERGMEYLVIDLRNNHGGYDEIGCALCDLLTDGEYYGQGLGLRRGGEYKCLSDHGIHGDGEFSDLKVVALTNYRCASAGDGTALYLSRLPNVTLAGITDPNGCNQETGGLSVLSEGLITVYFPMGLILNEEGEPNVDTTADRLSRNPVEERIPLDYDAAMKIFRDKKDYELDWAVRYLEAHAADGE